VRNKLFRFAEQVIDTCKPEESFTTNFEDATQMVAASKAFRSHGCKTQAGEKPFQLLVSVPKPLRVTANRSGSPRGR